MSVIRSFVPGVSRYRPSKGDDSTGGPLDFYLLWMPCSVVILAEVHHLRAVPDGKQPDGLLPPSNWRIWGSKQRSRKPSRGMMGEADELELILFSHLRRQVLDVRRTPIARRNGMMMHDSRGLSPFQCQSMHAIRIEQTFRSGVIDSIARRLQYPLVIPQHRLSHLTQLPPLRSRWPSSTNPIPTPISSSLSMNRRSALPILQYVTPLQTLERPITNLFPSPVRSSPE